MESSDIVIALPEDSLGVAIELGWASAMKKEIFLILDRNFSYSPLVQSLDAVSSTKAIWVSSSMLDPKSAMEMIVKKLQDYLNSQFVLSDKSIVSV